MRSQSLETNQFFFKNSPVQKYTRISPYLSKIEIIISKSKKKKDELITFSFQNPERSEIHGSIDGEFSEGKEISGEN